MNTITGRTSTRFTEVMKIVFFLAVFSAVVVYAINNDEGGEFVSIPTPAQSTTAENN